jgi:hypothetical protein
MRAGETSRAEVLDNARQDNDGTFFYKELS